MLCLKYQYDFYFSFENSSVNIRFYWKILKLKKKNCKNTDTDPIIHQNLHISQLKNYEENDILH